MTQPVTPELLADELERVVAKLAITPMPISLGAWSDIANPILAAATALRTSPRDTDREAVLREALEEITRRCELALEPLPVASPFARDLRQIMGMVAALNPKEQAS